ncbi:hypothetical protein PR202_ga16353 [Eleusine coracana subsp. coracana]|uniref:MHD2 domain-containing protein n=1 Tax=Eleusine coracana subsp. coracana TaxID=191504 RepID=A0AAV5CLE8_ELECO|nr:hypothetical protein PR202_ga16353 [Eleusine coracana subsp. coracana]
MKGKRRRKGALHLLRPFCSLASLGVCSGTLRSPSPIPIPDEGENAVELLQRYRRDRQVLLNYILSGNLIKKVVMPPGAISLDDIDIDQVSVDYVLNCAKKGEPLDLGDAIRLFHDSLDYPYVVSLSILGITDDDLRETAYEILVAAAGASGAEFSDMKAYLRWQKRQLNMLEEGLINHPVVGFGELGRKVNELRNLFRKIEESESLPPSAAEVQHTECLRSLREVATSLSERPARGDLTGEVCHWADGYHLNVALYEKMLGSVFDILDEGKLTEEVEEILELLKSTWRILGIAETVHDTCYVWVLFRQDPSMMSDIVTVAILTRRILGEENDKVPVLYDHSSHLITGGSVKYQFLVQAMESPDRDQIDHYITSSVKNAFVKDLGIGQDVEYVYNNNINKASCPKQVGRPFLEHSEHLTEDVVSVFPAADSLEQCIMSTMSSVVGDDGLDSICRQKLSQYQIENKSGTLVLRWVNGQLEKIETWVKRAADQEVCIVSNVLLCNGRASDWRVDKDDLVPPVPVLTRYKKELGIKAFVRKEVHQEVKTVDERKASEITQLTMPRLCVRLNSLYRMCNQKYPLMQYGQPFIDNLYKNSVSQARLDTIMEVLDLVLNQLCDVIVEQLRDRVVTGLLQASLDGLLRVILDGGSTRVFSPSDAPLLEEDLETLKEFFISGGDGLPRGTVENLVSRVRPVINLIQQETRVLIDDLREVTQGSKSKFGTDSKTLLRVLCHRNDSEASHYVKKQFKIPSSAPST